jgi:hypothetical protein
LARERCLRSSPALFKRASRWASRTLESVPKLIDAASSATGTPYAALPKDSDSAQTGQGWSSLGRQLLASAKAMDPVLDIDRIVTARTPQQRAAAEQDLGSAGAQIGMMFVPGGEDGVVGDEVDSPVLTGKVIGSETESPVNPRGLSRPSGPVLRFVKGADGVWSRPTDAANAAGGGRVAAVDRTASAAGRAGAPDEADLPTEESAPTTTHGGLARRPGGAAPDLGQGKTTLPTLDLGLRVLATPIVGGIARVTPRKFPAAAESPEAESQQTRAQHAADAPNNEAPVTPTELLTPPAEPTAPTTNPGQTPGGELERVVFDASHFPTADLAYTPIVHRAYTAKDPGIYTRIRQFSDWMAKTANEGRAQLTKELGTSSSPENTMTALENLLEFLKGERHGKAGDSETALKIITKIPANDPNIDPFGDLGNTALGPLQRMLIGTIIYHRLSDAAPDSLRNLIVLPGFAGPFEGNRLIQGAAAERINEMKGNKYDFQGSESMYFTETAPPAAQERLRKAALWMLASLVSRSAAIQASAAGHAAAFHEFALGLYSLFHAPVYNRGSDSVIRLFGGIIYRQVFGHTVALPQNVDIMAYAVDQHAFVSWLSSQMAR